MKIQNVTLTPVPLDAGASDDALPHAPPPDNLQNFHLPSGDEIAQRLKEQRKQQAGGATQESAVVNMIADGSAAAGPYALLGEPPLASALDVPRGTSTAVAGSLAGSRLNPPLPPLHGGIIVIGGAGTEGETPPLGHLDDPKNRDIGKELDGLRHRAQSTSASGVSDPLAAAGLNPQPLPPGDEPGDVDAPGRFDTDPLKVHPPH